MLTAKLIEETETARRMSQPILLALAVVASQAAGVPLYTYYASGAKDNFVVATAVGEQYAAANGHCLYRYTVFVDGDRV